MPTDPGALQASTISIGQTVVAYQFFLPTLREVRQADPGDPRMRGDVFLGQVAAGSVSLGVGILLGWMTGSKLPLVVSAFIALVIAGLYHYALNGQRAE